MTRAAKSPTVEDRCLSLAEAAQYLGCSKRMVAKLMGERSLVFVRLGPRTHTFPLKELAEFRERRTIGAKAQKSPGK